MEVWVPPINRVKDNQFIKMNLFDEEYWYLYGNETDPEVRNQLLYTYDNPKKENERRMLLHTDEGLEEESKEIVRQSDNEHDQRNLQNFDTLNVDVRELNSTYYDPYYNEKWKNNQNNEFYTRAMDMAIMIVAKPDPTRTRTTVLTVDHFREIQRFEEWLDKLEYPFEVPGIP